MRLLKSAADQIAGNSICSNIEDEDMLPAMWIANAMTGNVQSHGGIGNVAYQICVNIPAVIVCN